MLQSLAISLKSEHFTYPGGLNVSLDPIFDMLNVLSRIMKILLDGVLVGAEVARLWGSTCLDWHTPRTVLDTCREIAWQGVLKYGQLHIVHENEYYIPRWLSQGQGR